MEEENEKRLALLVKRVEAIEKEIHWLRVHIGMRSEWPPQGQKVMVKAIDETL